MMSTIKEQCELAYKQIKDAEERLKELRSICKHENTFEGDWSYRIASSFPAIICSDCGKLIKWKDDKMFFPKVTAAP